MYSGIFSSELQKQEAIEDFIKDVIIPEKIYIPGERFAENRKKGEALERKIADALGIKYEEAKNHDEDNKYDLEVKVNDMSIYLEIKDESNYADGENICIETSKGPEGEEGPAGLTATLSDFMIHYFSDEEIYIYESLAMLASLDEEHEKYFRYNISREKNSNGYVMPRTVALKLPTARKVTLSELKSEIEKGVEKWI